MKVLTPRPTVDAKGIARMDEQIVSEDKREISHLLMFFALVYLVEGLGQTG